MIKDLKSDRKNELKFLKTVLKSIDILFNEDVENKNIKFFQIARIQYCRELEIVLNRISYDLIQSVNIINNDLINKISEFRCTYILNKSSIIRNSMIETLCRYISKKQFELNFLIN